MTPTPAQFITAAREWVGTPFKHQGRHKGVGVDCIGVVYCTGRDMGIVDPAVMVPYARSPDGELLPDILDTNMQRVHKLQPGDVLLFKFITEPQHVAVYTGRNIIHAYAKIGKCIEHRYDKFWSRRLVDAYRFKEFVT